MRHRITGKGHYSTVRALLAIPKTAPPEVLLDQSGFDDLGSQPQRELVLPLTDLAHPDAEEHPQHQLRFEP